MGRNAQRRRAARAAGRAARALPEPQSGAGPERAPLGQAACLGCLELHIDGSTSCELGDDCTGGAHEEWLDCLEEIDFGSGLGCTVCHLMTRPGENAVRRADGA